MNFTSTREDVGDNNLRVLSLTRARPSWRVAREFSNRRPSAQGDAPRARQDGVTALEAADCAPMPRAFLAATLNVYVVPFVSPVTTWVVAVEL